MRIPLLTTGVSALILAVSGIVFGLPATAGADIKNCNGVFTDKACDQLNVTPTRSPQDVDLAVLKTKKQVLVTDLRSKLIRERKKSEVTLDISEAEELCTDPTTSLTKCREVVSKLDRILEERAIARRTLIAQEKASSAPTVSPDKAPQNRVVIVQPRVYPTPRRPIASIEVGVWNTRGRNRRGPDHIPDQDRGLNPNFDGSRGGPDNQDHGHHGHDNHTHDSHGQAPIQPAPEVPSNPGGLIQDSAPRHRR